jgi:hypothetical protein
MCTTDRWLRGRAGTPLRSLLTTHQIDEVTGIPGSGGDLAGSGFCIIRMTNYPPARKARVALVGPDFPESIDDYVQTHAFPVDHDAFGEGGWSLRDTRAEAILEKSRQAGTPLEEYVMGELHPGTGCPIEPEFVIDTRARKALVSADPRCKSFLRPVIDGAGIGRYEPVSVASYRVFIPRGWTLGHPAAASNPWRWFKKRHPVLARLLRELAGCTSSETSTEQGEPGNCWWETACDDDIFREKTPRIFFRDRFTEPGFFYDEGRAIPGMGAVALPASGPYLAGLLNSRLIAFVFAKTAGASGRERTEHSWEDLRNLPVYTLDFDDPADAGRNIRIASFVIRMLDLKKHLLDAKTDAERGELQEKIDATDRKIDRIVYGLYGLTPEEIEVVESAKPEKSPL